LRNAEEKLVEEHAPLAADFLKAAHHGSKTSSTEDLIAAVGPRVAVVSVGEANPFGHPSESVVDRLEQHGVRLLRADREGAVTELTDGTNPSVRTYVDGDLAP
jgi:competence protein ComEC